ncbi:MAG: hypothetical protein ACRCTE_03375 [Cellulosilyticaceae bacterium]
MFSENFIVVIKNSVIFKHEFNTNKSVLRARIGPCSSEMLRSRSFLQENKSALRARIGSRSSESVEIRAFLQDKKREVHYK